MERVTLAFSTTWDESDENTAIEELCGGKNRMWLELTALSPC